MEREQLNAAFGQFLNTSVYRDVERDLYDLIRTAFVAGWCAARNPLNQADEAKPPR